jgi:catechol 2,3-dioxygenase-like lactoylglutathione lyase family enzyme
MDWKLEVLVVPVSDVDRAKEFYADRLGFPVDTDFRGGEDSGSYRSPRRGRPARSSSARGCRRARRVR